MEKYRAEFTENLRVNHKEPRGEAVRAHLATAEVKPSTASPTDPAAQRGLAKPTPQQQAVIS